MVVMFRTALPGGGGGEVTDWLAIARHYLTGWFLIDLVSSMPWNEVEKIVLGNHASINQNLLTCVRRERA